MEVLQSCLDCQRKQRAFPSSNLIPVEIRESYYHTISFRMFRNFKSAGLFSSKANCVSGLRVQSGEVGL